MNRKRVYEELLAGRSLFSVIRDEWNLRNRFSLTSERLVGWEEKIKTILLILIKAYVMYLIFYKGSLPTLGFEKTVILLIIVIILLLRSIARGLS